MKNGILVEDSGDQESFGGPVMFRVWKERRDMQRAE